MVRSRKLSSNLNPGGMDGRVDARRKSASAPSLIAVALFLVSLAFLGLTIFLLLSGP